MPLPFIATLLIGLAMSLIGVLLMPKPPVAKPPETKDIEAPVADPSMPIPVVFGTVRVKGLNTLAYDDLRKTDSDIPA